MHAYTYFGGRLAYHIERPITQFLENVAQHNPQDCEGAIKRYETPEQAM